MVNMFPTSVVLLTTTITSLHVHGITGLRCPGKCNCTDDRSEVLINCTSRGLSQLPDDLPGEATKLLLSDNNLERLDNSSFTSVPNLTVLDLSLNKISRIESNSFTGLSKLIYLNLSSNHLPLSPQTYPEDVFKPLLSLEVLYLNKMLSSQTWQRSLNKSHDTSGKIALANDNGKTPVLKINNESDSLFLKSKRLDARNPDLFQDKLLSFKATNAEDDLDYPAESLSKLVRLQELHIDGLTNKTFGPEFLSLTRLTNLSLNGDKGHCALVTVTNATFLNLPHLQNLDVANCDIQNLSADAFSVLVNLTSLEMSFNSALGLEHLAEAFYGLTRTKLETLVINGIVDVSKYFMGFTITKDHLEHFRNLTHLHTVVAGYNMIRAFDKGVLCECIPPSLTEAYLNGNPLLISKYFNDLACLQNLQVIHVNGYESSNTPWLTFPEDSRCSAEHVRFKSRCAQDTERKAALVLPPQLHTLQTKHFGLFYKLGNITIDPNNSLWQIDSSDNHFPVWAGPVMGLEKLTKLILQDSFCESISTNFFQSFPHLEVLDISGNPLRDVIQSDQDGNIFQALKSLKKLSLARMDIGQIPRNVFRGLYSLEVLDLSVNGIGVFTPDILHMKNISNLKLSKNLLNVLPEEVRNHLDEVSKRQNVTIDMSYNPIDCVCDNIDFLLWIRDSRVYFGNSNNYFCQENGVVTSMHNVIFTIDRYENKCRSINEGIFVWASLSFIFVVIVLVIALTYRFRWKLRYLYYATRLSLRRSRSLQRDVIIFDYDAFVSFSSEDTQFVLGEMRSQLEVNLGLRLCIHTRDFTPGQYIASSVVDSVQRSRHTLIILTRALLQSEWCRYELQMALMEEAHSDRDVPIFLLYDDVPSQELPHEVLFNIQAHSYIEFPHSEINREPFWKRLSEALRN